MLWCLLSAALAGPLDDARRLRRARLPDAADLLLIDAWLDGSLPPAAQPEALARLTARYDETRDPAALEQLLGAGIPLPEADALDYLRGVSSWEAGEQRAALDHFAAISADAPSAPWGDYIAGTIYHAQGRYKSAAGSFHRAYTAPHAERALRDRALLGIGWAYFRFGRYEEADRYLSLIAPDSLVWPQVLLTQAWGRFYLGEPPAALGLLLALRSPQLRAASFFPEAGVLEAIIYFEHCNYAPAVRLAEQAEGDLAAISATLAEISRAPEPLRRLGDLPAGVQARLLQDRDLSVALDRYTRLGAELGSQRLSPPLRERVAAAQQAAHSDAGARLAELASVLRREAGEHQLQAEILRYEVPLSASRGCQLGRLGPEPRVYPFSCALGVSFTEWPFHHEFWADELGAYQVQIQDRCW